MANKRKRKQKRSPNPVLIVAVAVLAVLLAFLIRGIAADRAADAAAQEGIAILESLAAKDPAEVDAIRRERDRKRLEAEREELLRQLNSGELDPFSLFQDYVILGDSRAVGFHYMGYLEGSRVLAEAGDTILDIKTNKESVLSLNPSYIFLCYGLNEIKIGLWDTPEEYAQRYMQLVAELKSRLPEATIVVSSILPAQNPAFELSSKLRDIPQWNEVLQATCEENGVLFVDNSQISKEHADLWDVDGIHVKKAFYPHWATELISVALMGGSDES